MRYWETIRSREKSRRASGEQEIYSDGLDIRQEPNHIGQVQVAPIRDFTSALPLSRLGLRARLNII
jgi:hypothetical protein